jgi:ABC-type nitrate/sulfonate/bicarbonate transport system ATPase subunit
MLVTHDVDEALLMSDRVIVLSRGPGARIAAIMDIPFSRPRDREGVMAETDYLRLRHELLVMLTGEAEAA